MRFIINENGLIFNRTLIASKQVWPLIS